MPTYAIGDIHGCNRTFQALLERLPLKAGDALILLGDLIDRGPDSKGVIDLIFRLREHGHSVICLRGNHEQLLLDALLDPDKLELWLFNGGHQTMASFGTDKLRNLPERYLDFFRSTHLWYETDGYLCVHGGPDFSGPDPLVAPNILLWNRRWYDRIDYGWLGKRIILHGHTPSDLKTIETQHANLTAGQYLNLDNGCVYAHMGLNKGSLGHLLAFSLDTKDLIIQECVE